MYSSMLCRVFGHQHLRDISSNVLLLPGWATKMGLWFSAITSCIRDCGTTNLGCLPFNFPHKIPSMSKKYSPFVVSRFCICSLQNESFFCSLSMISLLINWVFSTSPTQLLSACTWLILLPGTCSISKSNLDERRLKRIRRLLWSAKFRRNLTAACFVFTENYFRINSN